MFQTDFLWQRMIPNDIGQSSTGKNISQVSFSWTRSSLFSLLCSASLFSCSSGQCCKIKCRWDMRPSTKTSRWMAMTCKEHLSICVSSQFQRWFAWFCCPRLGKHFGVWQFLYCALYFIVPSQNYSVMTAAFPNPEKCWKFVESHNTKRIVSSFFWNQSWLQFLLPFDHLRVVGSSCVSSTRLLPGLYQFISLWLCKPHLASCSVSTQGWDLHKVPVSGAKLPPSRTPTWRKEHQPVSKLYSTSSVESPIEKNPFKSGILMALNLEHISWPSNPFFIPGTVRRGVQSPRSKRVRGSPSASPGMFQLPPRKCTILYCRFISNSLYTYRWCMSYNSCM